MSGAATSSAFAQTLSAEAQAVGQFVDLLGREQVALTEGRTDILPALAEEKGRLAILLSQLASARNAALAAQGLEPDRAGVAAWCARNSLEKKAEQDWQMILARAREARELIRVNGDLITLRMQYNSKALEALQGGNQSLDLYGPDGQSTASESRRINDAV